MNEKHYSSVNALKTFCEKCGEERERLICPVCESCLFPNFWRESPVLTAKMNLFKKGYKN